MMSPCIFTWSLFTGFKQMFNMSWDMFPASLSSVAFVRILVHEMAGEMHELLNLKVVTRRLALDPCDTLTPVQ